MSGHPLAPGELARALEAYRATGTYRAAAAAIGRDESTVRKALRRHLAPERAELHAEALDTAHEHALRAARKARRRASSALDTATDPRDVGLLAHVLHEHLRAVTAARTALHRLMPPATQTEGRLGSVVEYDAEALEGARAQLAEALTRVSDADLELLGTGDPEALRERVSLAVGIVVAATLQGNDRAARGLAALLVVSNELAGGRDVVALPSVLARPREEQPGMTVYMPQEHGSERW